MPIQFSESELSKFNKLLLRARKAVSDIESLPDRPHERGTFRNLLKVLYEQTKEFVEKNPDFTDDFKSIDPEMMHQSPMTFEASLKNLRSFLDVIENEIISQNKLLPPKQFIILPGQAFTASKIIEAILIIATKSIKIVDNFMSEESVKIIETANSQRDLYIITKNPTSKFIGAIKQAKKGRKGLTEVRESFAFHDRYLIVDDSDIYLCGSSLDYLGINKPGAIVKIEEKQIAKIITDFFKTEWLKAKIVL